METTRFLLFGSDKFWSGLPEDKIDGRVSLEGCIALAREVGMTFMLVIDRYHPQVPIYLDDKNGYNPL